MGNINWGFVMLGGLMLLCIGIIIVASFYAVWLIRLVYSVLTDKVVPDPPFSKKKSESTS